MQQYTVTATIQSVRPGPPAQPTDMRYATRTDLARAIVAAGQALTGDDKYTRTISVRIDVIEVEDTDDEPCI